MLEPRARPEQNALKHPFSLGGELYINLQRSWRELLSSLSSGKKYGGLAEMPDCAPGVGSPLTTFRTAVGTN